MSSQISIPELGSKENPIFVKSEEEIKSNIGKRIKFICISCGKESTREQRKGTHTLLLCKPCKSSQTCKEKYNVDHPGQIPFVKEHIRETLNKNGGYTFQRESSMEKVKNTMKERYGVEKPMDSEEIKNKLKETNIKRYGGVSPMSSKEIKNKVKETTIKNHGKDFWYENLKKANLKNIGVENPFYLEENRRQKFYEYDNQKFDSSWELYFYIYNKDLGKNIIRNSEDFFTYEDNGKVRKYFPDFKIDDKYYEVKGSQFFNENNEPIDYFGNDWSGKYNCMLLNGVNIISYSEIKPIEEYILSKYGIDFISNLKVLKK